MSTLPFILTGGGFQDSDGNPLAYGSLTAKLSADAYLEVTPPATTSSILVCAGQTLEYALDDEGNVSTSPPQYIWPNNLLTNALSLQVSFYQLSAFSADGQLVWGPNACILDGALGYSLEVQTELPTNNVTTVFTLPYMPVTDSLIVYSNGLAMTPGVDYTLSAATITFAVAPVASDEVIADYYVGTGGLLPVFQQDNFSSGSTVYTLSETPVAGTVKLFQGGVLQSPNGVSYTISGSTITFNSATTRPVYAVYQTDAGGVASTGQVPQGTLNGVNRVFTLNSAASVSLFVNGVRQDSTSFSQSGATITLETAPLSWYQLYAYYDAQQLINLNDIAPGNPA
jgi:hypothetical protein